MKPPKFKPHFNRELGKKYYSEKDYKADMKSHGVEPYNPDSINKPVFKAYQRSEWAKAMHQDIINRNGRPPGDKFIKELDKRGINQKSYNEARRLANER